MNKIELKSKLKTLANQEWDLNDLTDIDGLAIQALEHIGTIDSELRDDLILEFLYGVIHMNKLNRSTLKKMLKACLSEEYCLCSLGYNNNDDVFKRSFSVLILRYLIEHENLYGYGIITKEEMLQTMDVICHLIKSETDYRDYTVDKGWVHSIAHAATAMRKLVLSPYINVKNQVIILETIRDKINNHHHVYIADETERLIMCVINILDKGEVSEKEMKIWLSSFYQEKPILSILEAMYLRENQLKFLRGLYFRLKHKEGYAVLCDLIDDEVLKINCFHHEMEN